MIHVVIDGYNPLFMALLGKGMSTYRQLKQQIAALEKKAAPVAKPAAMKAPKKPAAKNVARSATKPQPAAKPAAPVTAEPAVAVA